MVLAVCSFRHCLTPPASTFIARSHERESVGVYLYSSTNVSCVCVLCSYALQFLTGKTDNNTATVYVVGNLTRYMHAFGAHSNPMGLPVPHQDVTSILALDISPWLKRLYGIKCCKHVKRY